MLDLTKCFSHSRDLGFITDPRGVVLATTAGADRALGYASEELIGQELSHLDDSGDLRRFFESRPVRSRMNLAFHLRTKEGAALAVGALATSLRDEKGEPVGWFLAGQDLKGAVGESRGTQPILDALMNSIGAALWSFDRNGTVLTWSRACEPAFGVSREEAEGKLSAIRLFPSPEEFHRVIERVDHDGRFSGELALKRPGGAARPNHVSITPLVTGALPVGYTCVSFDIADRKRAEDLQRTYFEQAGEAIVVVDMELLRVVDVNDRACEMHGFSREEFLGLHVQEIVDESNRPDLREVVRKVKAAGRYEGEHHASRKKDGSKFPAAINLRQISVGGRDHIIAVVRDLTEQRKAQEFFRVLFEKASDAVYLVADEGLRVVEANEAAGRMLGYTREEFLKLGVVDLVPPSYRHRIPEFHASIRNGSGYRRDRRVLYRKDGTIVPTDHAVSRVEIAGRPYYMASCRDVSDQERAAQELAEAKAFLEHVQENASDGLALLDERGVYVAVNRKLLEWRGERREDILGTPWMKNTTPEKMQGYQQYWGRLMKGERISMRTTIEPSDGAPQVTVEVSSAMIQRGERKFVFAIVRDVSDQVRSETQLLKSRVDLERHVAERTAQLRESEERFRAAFEKGCIGMALVGPDGRFLQANRSLCEMLGYGEEELLATTFQAITHPDDQEKSAEVVLRMLGGESSVRLEKRYFHRDGRVVWADLSSTLIRDAAGKPLHFVTSIQDITERKRTKEELERRVLERTAELARANTLLQEEIVERKRAEHAFRLILEGTAAVTGGSFFRSLVRQLASALHVKYACVVRGLGVPPTRARVVASWSGSDFAGPAEYDLADTPCESVIRGEVCCYTHDLQRLFPQLKMLADLGAESYLGVPMVDSIGSVVGHLWVMDVNPVSDVELKLSVLKIFAARAGAELERQMAEEALRESEERWRSLVAHAPDIILTIDAEGRILSINRTVTGFTPQSVIGRPAREFVLPETVPVMEECLRKAFQDGQPSTYETQSYGPNLTKAWYITRVSPIKIEGKVVGATFISTDITERWKAEKRQKMQHEVTRVLAEAPSLEAAAPRLLRCFCEVLDWQVGFLWWVDPAAGVLRLVDAWHPPLAAYEEFAQASRALSFPPGKGLVGAAWSERKPMWTPDAGDQAQFVPSDIPARAGLRTQFVLPVDGPQGTIGVIEFLATERRERDEPLLLLASTLGSQVGQFVERKRVEEDLRIQKSLLESQSEAAIDGILVVSRNGVMTSFNRRFCQMWDIPDAVIESRADELALQSVLDKLVDPREFLDRVHYLYDHPDEESRDEIHLKDGRAFDRYSAPVKGTDGVLYGRVWYFRDITGRKQTEENLRRAAEETRQMYEDLKAAQAQLIRSEKLASIGMLVSGVAHEINNPLNVMYGNLQLLAEVSDVLLPLSLEGARSKRVRGTAGKVAKFRGMIRDALKAARHAREIVHDFRNFARDTRTAELVDLNDCLSEAVTLMQRELRPGIRVVRKLGKIPQVRCLRGQISQVFLNLLKNAGEAIERKGTVTLRTVQKDGHVLVEVADSGRGMTEEVRQKLFEPFFTTKPVGKGLGLGLSISAMIVHNHSGRITVRSQQGRGSVFRVELPAHLP